MADQHGLKVQSIFAQKTDPYDTVTWVRRDAKITDSDGTIVFEMKDIEVPAEWSQRAVDIVASKYFRKAGVPQEDGSLGPETSVRQVVQR
jgi:ribonucleoside-diphosphate reductase alpha chain